MGPLAEVLPVLRIEARRHPVGGGSMKLWDNGAPSWGVVFFVMWLGWVAVVVMWLFG
jgi:hypothetical protein